MDQMQWKATYTWYGVIFFAPRLRVSLTVSSTMLAIKSSNAFAIVSGTKETSFCQRCVLLLKVFERSSPLLAADYRSDLQMRTGVACATLPTSSSACMIFLIRATGNLHCADRFTMLDVMNLACVPSKME